MCRVTFKMLLYSLVNLIFSAELPDCYYKGLV